MTFHSPDRLRTSLWLFLFLAMSANATVYEIFPTGMTSNCNEEFENVANSLQPGDELILHDGIYAQGCSRRITINGTPGQPIIVRAADGAAPLITRPPETSSGNNNVELTGSHYTIRGLRFQRGSAGVRFLASNNIIFEDNEIFDTLNNALTMNQANTDSHIIRNNHLHHTGLADGSTEGEGMYIGDHNGNFIATNHLIENNYIHHLRATSSGGNDGIEVKYGSGGNIIRGNVIHDTNIGRQYPCIFVYGYGSAPNIVENNTVYNCGEAILVTADAVIRNNLVLNSSVNGIHLNRQNPAPAIRDVTIVNNTVYGHPVCAQLNIGNAPGIVVANNAFYCEGATSVSGNSFANAAIDSNYASGAMSGGASIDNASFFSGGTATSAFVSPTTDNFRLSDNSLLIDAGNGSVSGVGAVDRDSNARVVGSAIDVGAYEYDGGPGANPPSVNLAGPNTIPSSASATLQWTSTDTESCVASGDWSGSKPTSGSASVGPLTEHSVFSLICTGPGGIAEDSHAVQVEAPSDDSDGDGLPDNWEINNFGNLSQNAGDDTDRDGASNGVEFGIATDPTDPDSDDDGLTDGLEISNQTDPLDPDSDDDGLTDGLEISNQTDPLDSDSDDDGLTDGLEISNQTDPLDPDSDDDGLTDGLEISNQTDPLDPDSDDDGLTDGLEISNQTDPLDPDSDDDGLADGAEIDGQTNPLDADTDDDGSNDGDEIQAGTDPKDSNSFPQSVSGGTGGGAESSDSGGGAVGLWCLTLLTATALRRRRKR